MKVALQQTIRKDKQTNEKKLGQFTLNVPKQVAEIKKLKKGDVLELELTDEGLLYKFPNKESE